MELIERLTIDGPRLVVRPNRRLAPFVPRDFEAVYPDHVDLAAMPRHIALLPFLWNVAPVVWAVGGEYTVEVLDRRVADSFTAIRAELRGRYPGLAWDGSVGSSSLVETPPRSDAASGQRGALTGAALFSGGVDSTWTALRHAGPGLLLVSVWGADTSLDREREWLALEARNRAFAGQHAGGMAAIRSNFRALRVARLSALSPKLHFWYLQVQHSPAFAGLAAPLLYWHGIPILWIPSTGTEDVEAAMIAVSRPSIDDRISLATARVAHDSFELSRQAKLVRIVAHQRESGTTAPTLRVCPSTPSPDGDNCGRCEKCLRTIVGLVLAGGDPREYGFPTYEPALLDEVPALYATLDYNTGWFHWRDIQDHARTIDGDDSPLLSWLRTDKFVLAPGGDPPTRRTPSRRLLNSLAVHAPRLYGWLRDAKRATRGAVRPR